jgi:CheY-like chemotaxis protein
MEAVGQLTGGIAHDFNNLLQIIVGNLETISRGLPEEMNRLRRPATNAMRGAKQAASLTQRLLAFARRQPLDPKPIDANALVRNMSELLHRVLGETVEIETFLGAGLWRTEAGPGELESALINLAVNARDAMPEGGTLTIETANVELDEHYAKTHLTVKPGSYVGLTVTDTGTGMTPQVQARLFEPFFTTKDPGKGTGLGLATVYGIVTRSGGSVGVYSEVGRGTAFKVYFPPADAAEMVAEAPAPPVRPHGGTQTVLVVEDEAGLREMAKRLLQRHGYTVLAAADAGEAIRLFEGNRSIDVLLTDVVMPGASGPELTRQLIEQRPALRVIYMSGYTEEAIVQHGVLKPGIAFLNKPFSSQALGEKIREVMDR